MAEEKKDQLQTITYDDFEKSLEHDGIEIIIPASEEEAAKALPEGIGAQGYQPRVTAPSTTNPYYLKLGKGGYNRCILISGNSCLPNCVGFAFGRYLECGDATANAKLPTCNAEDWLAVAKNNKMQTGSLPRLGAVIVWKSGNFWNGADGCGHVAVVERIYEDGSILVSQSNYGGTRFFLTRIYPPYNITGQTFIGFIYNEYVKCDPHWVKDSNGWWYDNGDGSYPMLCWKKIDGKWYYFDKNGYMVTGWLSYKGAWYYLTESGAMATGWIKIKETWYFLDADGRMVTGWIHYKNAWYYCDSSGAMVTGNKTVPAYFDKNGALARQ